MRVSRLIKQLKAIHEDIPFDADLAECEFGIPGYENALLIDIKHGAPFIVLVFGSGEPMKTSVALEKLEKMAAEVPFDAVVTNGRLGDQHNELVKVYHDPPITILELDYEYDEGFAE